MQSVRPQNISNTTNRYDTSYILASSPVFVNITTLHWFSIKQILLPNLCINLFIQNTKRYREYFSVSLKRTM